MPDLSDEKSASIWRRTRIASVLSSAMTSLHQASGGQRATKSNPVRTQARLARALGRYADRLAPLAPGVDTEMFRPGLGADVRALLGLATEEVDTQ